MYVGSEEECLRLSLAEGPSQSCSDHASSCGGVPGAQGCMQRQSVHSPPCARCSSLYTQKNVSKSFRRRILSAKFALSCDYLLRETKKRGGGGVQHTTFSHDLQKYYSAYELEESIVGPRRRATTTESKRVGLAPRSPHGLLRPDGLRKAR